MVIKGPSGVCKVVRHQGADCTTLVFRGSLDAGWATALRPRLQRAIAGEGQRVLLDLAGLNALDADGLRTLVFLSRSCRTRGVSVNVTGVKGQPLVLLRWLAEVSRLQSSRQSSPQSSPQSSQSSSQVPDLPSDSEFALAEPAR
jgi:anti-anti-sigma factor